MLESNEGIKKAQDTLDRYKNSVCGTEEWSDAEYDLVDNYVLMLNFIASLRPMITGINKIYNQEQNRVDECEE